MNFSPFHLLSVLAACLCCLGMGNDSFREIAGYGFQNGQLHQSVSGTEQLFVWNEEEHKIRLQRRHKPGTGAYNLKDIGRTAFSRRSRNGFSHGFPEGQFELTNKFFHGVPFDGSDSNITISPVHLLTSRLSVGLSIASPRSVTSISSFADIIPYETLRPH